MKRLAVVLRQNVLLFEHAKIPAERGPAMDFVGIDLRKTSSQTCALGEGGE
jgi:hypothetical protein